MAIIITSVSIAVVQLVWMIIFTTCYCKKREEGCTEICGIVTSAFFFFMALGIVIMVGINFGGINGTSASLKEWSKYSDCVDSYMQID